jgi:Exoribonuclease Xrn1 D1 domain
MRASWNCLLFHALRRAPTSRLAYHPHTHAHAHAKQAKPIKLNVFGSESRYETMVLSLRRPQGLPTAEQLSSRVIGRSVFVNWPLLHEAQARNR